MIPSLDPVTGHLPVGRYVATLSEIEDRFVNAPDFAASSTRASVWEGFERWLATWAEIEDRLDSPGLLRRLWLAGSFISSEQEPDDLDVTPFIDWSLAQAVKGRPGSGALRTVIGHRPKVSTTYRVEPFPVWWIPVESILRHDDLAPEEREYLAWRGALDDLWQRVRPPGPKGPLLASNAEARRGYVEVIL